MVVLALERVCCTDRCHLVANRRAFDLIHTRSDAAGGRTVMTCQNNMMLFVFKRADRFYLMVPRVADYADTPWTVR